MPESLHRGHVHLQYGREPSAEAAEERAHHAYHSGNNKSLNVQRITLAGLSFRLTSSAPPSCTSFWAAPCLVLATLGRHLCRQLQASLQVSSLALDWLNVSILIPPLHHPETSDRRPVETVLSCVSSAGRKNTSHVLHITSWLSCKESLS